MARRKKRVKNYVNVDSTLRKLTTQLTDPRVIRSIYSSARGVRQRLLKLDYFVLRNVVEKVELIEGIINTRCDQIAPFAKYATEEGDKGFRFELERTTEKSENGEYNENEVIQLSNFIEQTGFVYDPDREDDFSDFTQQIVREILTIDQIATEIQYNRIGEAVAFWLLDGSCYSADTEILTETRGWVLFKDLYGDDRVATRNKEGVFEWQLPIAYVARPYKGKMIHFNHRSMDILVHPDHRMLYERKRYDLGYDHTTFGIKAAKNIVGKPGYSVPLKSDWKGTLGIYTDIVKIGGYDVSLKDWVAFLGIYLSDGCTTGNMGGKNKYAKAIYISRPVGTRHYDEVYNLLINVLPFKFVLQNDGKNFYVTDPVLWKILHPLGNVYTKYIPLGIKNLPKEYLSILWEWALKGDGSESFTKSGRVKRNLTTVSYRLASDYQEIVQKIGLSASITLKKMPKIKAIFKKTGRQIKTQKQAYIVSELVSNVRSLKGHYEDYDDMIYCVTVPNEILYTRRNGYAVWCGNTIRRVDKESDFAKGIRFVQEIDQKIYAKYTAEQLIFDYKYKRADVRYRGYGFSPTEMAINIITTLLFGYNYMRDELVRDKVPKGFISVMGDVGKPQLDAIREYWYYAMSGAGGQWNIPIVPSGKDGVGLEFKALNQSNKDMEYHKLMMFISSLIAAVFSIDLAEMGIKTDDSTALIGENSAPRIESSKDRGLGSLLFFIEQYTNKILRKVTQKYRFKFSGFVKEDEIKKADVRNKQLSSYKTINELREEDGLDKIDEDYANVVLNPQAVQIYMGQQGQIESGEEEENEEGESGYGEYEPESVSKALADFRRITDKKEKVLHIKID